MTQRKALSSSIVVRGRVFTDDLVDFGGRGGELRFKSPDPMKYAGVLPLASPQGLKDLYQLSFDDILDYLEELGKALDVRCNSHLQQARELCCQTAPTPPTLVDDAYRRLPGMFDRQRIVEIAESCLGIEYLEGWVAKKMLDGRTIRIRAFGSRAVHITAGNTPLAGASTVIRNAITRSDAIVKSPSNDPFTTLAIARTMCDLAPDHPITKHMSVTYWKGGDVEFEQKLYHPANVNKIVAYGGFAAMKHVTRYIQPGLELVALDPKRSAAVIGPEAFASDTGLKEVSLRAALDVGAFNGQACVCPRTIYVLSGTDEEGLEKVNRLGESLYDSLFELPERMSTKPLGFSPELKASLEALSLDDTWYRVIGGEEEEGAVIVSKLPEPVDFVPLLTDRVVNLVPVDSLDEVTEHIDSYTQTIGVYPESLKEAMKDRYALYGAQRFVSLGYATYGSEAVPQDGIEPLRRMCMWILDEACSPETVQPNWR